MNLKNHANDCVEYQTIAQHKIVFYKTVMQHC